MQRIKARAVRLRALADFAVPALSAWAARALSMCAALALCACAAKPPTQAPPPPASEGQSAHARRLTAARAASPPAVDGAVDAVWENAAPLSVPLTWHLCREAGSLEVELRALYTDDALYWLAKWPGQPPSGERDTVYNLLTLHWRVPDAEGRGLSCDVVCHTASAGGNGRLAYANAETIPQGGAETLDAAGGWDGAAWVLEWTRPRVSENPLDVRFAEREASYLFRVKVFERSSEHPDPVSEQHALVFGP